MDQPGLEPARHAHALRGLARINLLSRSAAILWPPLAASARAVAPRPLRVLDLATGAGDVPLRLWKRARRAGLSFEIAGCDVSPLAVEHARASAAHSGAPISFFRHDVLADPPPGGYDAVTSSLFLHHLDDERAVPFLRNMARMAPLVLVNDLLRGWLGMALAYVGTRLLTTSRVVHTDGLRSVAAAFTVAEVRRLAEAAGLHQAAITRHWPCRFRLAWGGSAARAVPG
jgi:2-polyprenyl-3-methyl-5-hydroxy-6-metoxy-1,4-benzoquinol methylase